VQAIGPTQRILNLYLNDHFAAEPLRIPAPDAQLLERAYTVSVALETPDGAPRSLVAVGEPWRVRIGVRICRPYPQLVVGLGLVAADGTPAQTAWNPPAAVSPGTYEFVFEQQTFLQAGTYTLLVGLSDSDQSLQQIEAARFDISGDDPHGYFPLTSGVGAVLNSMTVSWKPV
jgi:hypothetical protein